MKRLPNTFVMALVVVLLTLSAGAANAVCSITGLTSITPVTASTGTYTPPTAPTAQALNITITGTYFSLLGGTCTVAISFNRSSLPASMAISGGGGATFPYTIQSLSGGGNTLLYSGGGVPVASNVLSLSFAAAILGIGTSFTANLTAYVLAQPGSPQAAGSYGDNPTVHIFNVASGGAISEVANRPFAVTGVVAKACLIGVIAHPTADTATIPVSAAGAVDTAVINKSYNSAACNTPSNVQLTSQNGAITTSGTPPSGFTNLINYSSTATFSGAAASLNTATNPAASGPESGTAVSTTGATPSGTMTVAITPQANASRLIAGSYTDTLTITITPQ